MADPIALQIRDNVAALLLANSGIATVSTTARIGFVADIPADAFPTIDVILSTEDHVYDPDETVENTGEILVVGVVKGIDLDAAEELIRDVKDQLATDQTLEGQSGTALAFWVRPFRTERDQGTWENSGFLMRCSYRYLHEFGTA